MVAAALVIPALVLSGTGQAIDDARAVREYAVAVEEYAQLHRIAVAGLPMEPPCRGAEQLDSRRTELAMAIRFARAGAHEGSLFTPAVAPVIRRRLHEALRALDMKPTDVLAAPSHAALLPAPIEINEFFPWEAGPPRWRALFWALPPLPEELEYRLVGPDLVLMDTGARLVVDVLRNAVEQVPWRHEHPARDEGVSEPPRCQERPTHGS